MPGLSTPAARARAVEQDRILTEQSDRYAVTLESILAALRAPRLTDAAARTEAIEIASTALVQVRSTVQNQQDLWLEPVRAAFSRLRAELRPLVRFGELDVQFAEPPANGRALPGPIARDARAIARTVILTLLDTATASRVRIQWDCDGRNLLVEIRDNGAGTLTRRDDTLRPVAERVVALRGELHVDSTPGWGSTVTVTIPLDPPAPGLSSENSEDLTPREADVLRLLTAGLSNQQIAEQLGITANTVKYHVAKLLRKYRARTRTELTSITRAPGNLE